MVMKSEYTKNTEAQQETTSRAVIESVQIKAFEFGAKNDRSFVWRINSKRSVGKIQCEVCRNVFPAFAPLIYHRRIHLDEFPFHCRICFYTFAEETQKNKHENNCDKLRYEFRRDTWKLIRESNYLPVRFAKCNSRK